MCALPDIIVDKQIAFDKSGQMNGHDTYPIRSVLEGAILVIDDDPDICDALVDILGTITESPVYSAANGHAGLQILRQKWLNIALIFLDMNMPVMNGEETYAQLQEVAPEVKVVISSSLSRAEAQFRLGQNEPSAFLQKPYGISALTQTMMTLFA